MSHRYHHLTSFEINDIAKELYIDKYNFCNNKNNIDRIFSSDILVCLLYELIEKDRLNKKKICESLYVCLLSHLLLRKKIINKSNWNKDDDILKILFNKDIFLCMDLINQDMITFLELYEVCNNDPDIFSDKIMEQINSQNDTPNISYEKLSAIIDVMTNMIQNNIPIKLNILNEKKCVEIIGYYLSKVQYKSSEFAKFFLNIFTYGVPICIYDDILIYSSINTYFNSDTFLDHFITFDKNSLNEFKKYLYHNTTNNNEFNNFTKKIIRKSKQFNPLFMSKYIDLLIICQDLIIKYYDADINYINTLKYSRLEDLSKLSFDLILSLDLCLTNQFGSKIFDLIVEVLKNNKININLVNKKLSEYKNDYTEDYSKYYITCLTHIIKHTQFDSVLLSDDKIDLLLYMIKNRLLDNDIIESLTNYNISNINMDYIASKNVIVCSDDYVVMILLKIFPNLLKYSLHKQILTFNQITKKLDMLIKKSDQIDQITLLKTLTKLNNSELSECKICYDNDISVFYKECGHTVCGKCASFIGNKCPHCSTISKYSKLFY